MDWGPGSILEGLDRSGSFAKFQSCAPLSVLADLARDSSASVLADVVESSASQLGLRETEQHFGEATAKNLRRSASAGHFPIALLGLYHESPRMMYLPATNHLS